MKIFFLTRFFILFTFLFSSNASVGQTLGAIKEKYKYVGIPVTEFSTIATYGKQHSMNWCWAACIQMILNYYQIPVNQEQIVKRTLGKLVDKPADPSVMFKALNGWEIDVYGNKVLVKSNYYSTNLKEITSFLATSKPLIVGLNQKSARIGHAYILIGLYYQTFKHNEGEMEYVPHSVQLVDPWPGNSNFLDMSWVDFVQRLNVSYKVWVN